MQTDPMEPNPSKLRKLASSYRDFAQRAGSPTIRHAQSRTTKELEADAGLVERTPASRNPIARAKPVETPADKEGWHVALLHQLGERLTAAGI